MPDTQHGRKLLHLAETGESYDSLVDLDDVNTWLLDHSLWPAVLYTVCLMVVGTVGNTLVLIVYRRHFRRSVTRMFIYSLAILDLGNCLITMPSELMILIRFASFPSASWCKLSRWLTYIFNGTSSLILITIALDRYCKVCHPTVNFITLPRARAICIGSLTFAAFVSIPALVIYGDMTLRLIISGDQVHILGLQEESYTSFAEIEHVTFNGTFCLVTAEYINTASPAVFYASMASLYAIMVIVVVFSYTRVAKTMFFLRSRHALMFSFYKDYRGSSSAIVEGKVAAGERRSEGQKCAERSAASGPISTPHPRAEQPALSQSGDPFSTASEADTARENQIQQEYSRVQCSLQSGEEEDAPTTTDEPLRVRSQSFESSRERFLGDVTGSNDELSSRDVTLGSRDETYIRYGSVNSRVKDTDLSQSCDGGSKVLTSSGIGLSEEHVSHYKSSNTNHRGETRRTCRLKSNQRPISIKNIPRIKIQKSKDDNGSEESDESVDIEIRRESQFLSSNNLLLRRIRSMDSVQHLSTRLHRLHIPVPGDETSARKKRSTSARKKLNITKSFNDLTKIKGVTKNLVVSDTASFQNKYVRDFSEKNVTLTKRSPKGKKKLYVLPLTGLSTKTAVHMLGAAPSLNSTETADKTHSRIRGSTRVKYVSHSVKKDDGIIDGKVDVILRSRSSQGNVSPGKKSKTNSTKSTQSDQKTPGTARRNPRKEIVSTADILKEQHRRYSLHPFRTSRMLFIISLVFVVGFCPFFIIALVRSFQGSKFLTDMTNASLGVISVFIRSSLISNAVNPIVYGLLSTHFRKECRVLMRSVLGR